MKCPLPMIIHDEVRTALANHKGVVALESTVISHGLPFPDNLEIAKELEKVIREEGAIPAMIALREGNIRVGLDESDLSILAKPKSKVSKLSRRDLAYTLATKGTGATTVAATMILAHHAGLKIFATGGIGGVHRGAEHSMDISADLHELSVTPIAVVCSGAKSILDLAKTLEVLETLGVPVWGFRTKFFPEFFCVGKRYGLDMPFCSEKELAKALKIHWSLDLRNGVIIAQSVPGAEALEPDFLEAIIQKALCSAAKDNVNGKALTPFLLHEIAEKTLGQSLKSNKALLLENARLAARIAVS